MNDAESKPTGDVNTSIIGHLTHAKQDMSHVQELLRAAVDSLLTDVFAIRDACRMQQQAAVGDGGYEDWRKSFALSRAIDQQIDASLRHLQFQDMVSQLLDHIRISLDSIETLAFPGAQSDAGRGHEIESENPECTGNAGAEVQQHRAKPVTTRDLQAGDIELF